MRSEARPSRPSYSRVVDRGRPAARARRRKWSCRPGARGAVGEQVRIEDPLTARPSQEDAVLRGPVATPVMTGAERLEFVQSHVELDVDGRRRFTSPTPSPTDPSSRRAWKPPPSAMARRRTCVLSCVGEGHTVRRARAPDLPPERRRDHAPRRAASRGPCSRSSTTPVELRSSCEAI